MELNRPRGITDQSWLAVLHHKERLDRAWLIPVDRGAAIGAAKELCESAARVVLEERAVAYNQQDNMRRLLSAAHATLDRRPGHGQAAQVAIRNLSQATLSITTILYELRNELGTGHGRAKVPKISLELAVAASDAATLWTRWALARLDDMMGGDVDVLLGDLRRGGWTRGKLETRFDEVDLDSLWADDQKRIGVAVAHRALGGTFVVSESGVDPLLEAPQEWPEFYRLGIASGLLLTSDGHLTAQPYFIPILGSIVTQMSTPDWATLSAELGTAPLRPGLAIDRVRLTEIRAALEGVTQQLPEGMRRGWEVLASRFSTSEAD